MADERRYGEDEVGEIFSLATSEGEAALPALSQQEGLTLAELQEVGREIGVSPERVAQAAATLDGRPGSVPARTLLGVPVTVGRIVDLPREATDREWQFLVAELRETFGEKGEVSAEGGVREWSHGKLHAVLEETEAGHRLRLGAESDGAAGAMSMGFVGIGMALFFFIVMIAADRTGGALVIPTLFALAGAGALVGTRMLLPKWTDQVGDQMDHIAGRAQALLEAAPREETDD
ncbi:MAG: hypothetical protein MJB57_05065 [Gemmatimonadetes bacterium]|nr:hypothetical protein [Gemmatimonadota bacterium]